MICLRHPRLGAATGNQNPARKSRPDFGRGRRPRRTCDHACLLVAFRDHERSRTTAVTCGDTHESAAVVVTDSGQRTDQLIVDDDARTTTHGVGAATALLLTMNPSPSAKTNAARAETIRCNITISPPVISPLQKTHTPESADLRSVSSR